MVQFTAMTEILVPAKSGCEMEEDVAKGKTADGKRGTRTREPMRNRAAD
jgi:hypothetical protein